jgi:hypothetical protein
MKLPLDLGAPFSDPNMSLSLSPHPFEMFSWGWNLESLVLFIAWLHFHSFRGNLKSIWLDFGSKWRIHENPRSAHLPRRAKRNTTLCPQSWSKSNSTSPRNGGCARLRQEVLVHASTFHKVFHKGSVKWTMSTLTHSTTPLAHQGDSMMRWSTRRTELLPCRADCDVLRPSKRLSWCSQMLVLFSCLMHIFYWMCWGSRCPPAARFHVLGSSVSFLCMLELRSSLFVD